MMLRLALCYAVALAAAPMLATFAAGSPQCTPPASVECALLTAGVRDPAAMTESLSRAELRTVADVAELDVAEAAEVVVAAGEATTVVVLPHVMVNWHHEQHGQPGQLT